MTSSYFVTRHPGVCGGGKREGVRETEAKFAERGIACGGARALCPFGY